MEQKNIKIFIIKNGKIVFALKDSKYPKENVDNLSNIEIKMYQALTGKRKEESQVVTLEQIYGDLSDNGYTVVRLNELKPNNCAVFIANIICKEDKDLALEIIKRNKSISKIIRTFNRNETDYGMEYETCIDPQEDMHGIGIFFNEKIGNASKYEEEALFRYRTFNISAYIGCEHEDDPIHNYDSGIVLITPDMSIQRPLKARTHLLQSAQIVRQLYYREYLQSKDEDLDFEQFSELFKTVLLQICGNEIYIYTPERINEFQYDELSDFISKINNIENSNGIKTVINYINCQKGDYEDTSSKGYLKYLKKNKKNIVGNIVELDRTSPPEVRKIDDNFLANIFGISLDNKTGENVRKELVQIAKNEQAKESKQITNNIEIQDEEER